MIRSSRRLCTVLAAAGLALCTSGCNKLKARDALNKGVAAYKGSQFDAAIEHFKQAKDLDPGLINARLYLATAYATIYIPGAPSEENVRNGQQALNEYQEVLRVDAQNLSAIDGIGSMLYNMGGSPYDPGKFGESRSYHQKHIQIRPSDPVPYYWVGVINWTLAYRANGELRGKYNESAPRKPLKDEEPLPEKLREEYAAQYSSVVDEGITALQKAMQLQPDYIEAMAYLNLLYRRKADMVATPEERDDYLTRADALVDQVKAVKQKQEAAPETLPQ